MKRVVIGFAVCCCLGGFAGSANAASVDIIGHITQFAANPHNITDESVLSGQIYFNDADYVENGTALATGWNITLGDRTFTEATDPAHPWSGQNGHDSWQFITFRGGSASTFDYLTGQGGQEGELFQIGEGISFVFENGNPDFEIYGSYELNNLQLSPVPVPGAAWLLGSGLIGLVGLRRKKKVAIA